ncbi:MAG: class I SAM-dependent methyltransferase [Dehalococcoidia bacterium]|jgi:ubiquinone/menaquinone biosynthesis C-methylase UbiE
MESIPGPGAWAYSKVVARSPFILDLYEAVAEEVCSKFTSGRILDIGTGPGLVPLKIARKSKALEIFAIDISHAMVEIATKNAGNAGMSEQTHFHYGSAEKIPFEKGYFDLAITTLSFHHWAKPEDCLKEVSRVLKENCELWIYEMKHEPTAENKKELKRKYGPFLSFLVLNFVRAHSSISFSKIEQVKECKDIGFAETVVEDKGMFVKLRLLK